MATTKSTRKRATKSARKRATSTPRKARKTTAKGTRRAGTAAKRTTKRTAKSARKTTKSAAKSARKTTKSAAKSARKTTKSAAKSAQKTVRKTARTAKQTARKVTAPATRKATGGPNNRSNGRGGRRIDALTFLKQEHREVEDMFKRFERAGSGAVRRKEQLRDSIVTALSQHAVIEETVFYPAVREEVRGAASTILESLEEHHMVKFALSECEDMNPSDERFTAKMTVMMENVRHHVKEEEQQLFPKVRRAMDRARLVELGDALQQAKRVAPTRPHPFSPDEPPGNVLVGGAVAVMDRARTTGKKAVRRVRRELPLV